MRSKVIILVVELLCALTMCAFWLSFYFDGDPSHEAMGRIGLAGCAVAGILFVVAYIRSND